MPRSRICSFDKTCSFRIWDAQESDQEDETQQPNYMLIAGFHDSGLGNLNSTVAMKSTVERQSLSSQFAPHARQMPAILAITKEAAEMQPDAIEATQLGGYSGVARGLEFMVNCHILFLFPGSGMRISCASVEAARQVKTIVARTEKIVRFLMNV